MGRFDRLPGIDDENTTRRNALIGGGYALLGVGALGALAPAEEDTDESSGNGQESANGGDDGEDNGDSESDPTETPVSGEPERSDDPELLHLSDLGDREEPYFAWESTTLSGNGASVTDAMTLQAELAAFVYEHSGDSNFIVEAYNDESGDRLATVINQIGAVSGATALPSQQLDVFLDIDANGPWEIVVAQPFAPEAEVRVPPARTNGVGNAVVGPIELAAGTTASGTHSGDGNFIVEFLPETAMVPTDGELVFNELNDFDGETVVSTDGVGWFDVEADGAWSLEVE
jgi:hypothetical protein